MKVLFILGPTGVGKSRLAVKLAKEYNGQVISCDSVQVYKGFDIGSAKVTKQEMKGVKHHLIDICQPNDYFSVSDFVEAAKGEIEQISNQGQLPIVVGGTGLYISGLLGGYNFGGVDRDVAFREQLEKMELAELVAMLKEVDEKKASEIDLKNKVRVVRAIEIAKFGSGQTAKTTDYDYKIFALTKPREQLYQAINTRSEQMIKDGLVDEVKTLLKNGAKPDCQPMRAIGYKEVLPYLDGKISMHEMEETIKQHCRNYAKRQMTYLRGMQKKFEVTYVDMQDYAQGEKQILQEVNKWLQ